MRARQPNEIMFGTADSPKRVRCNEDLAARVGCAPSTLRKWRAGDFPETFRMLSRFCRITKMSNEDILETIRNFEKCK